MALGPVSEQGSPAVLRLFYWETRVRVNEEYALGRHTRKGMRVRPRLATTLRVATTLCQVVYQVSLVAWSHRSFEMPCMLHLILDKIQQPASHGLVQIASPIISTTAPHSRFQAIPGTPHQLQQMRHVALCRLRHAMPYTAPGSIHCTRRSSTNVGLPTALNDCKYKYISTRSQTIGPTRSRKC